MISSQCFERKWLLAKAAELRCRNPVLLEKATMAMQLVGLLAERSLKFQFKGGTSLLLRLKPIRRLSIDVDILCQESPTALEAALAGISKSPRFQGFDHDASRDREFPPKKHFQIFYPSVIEPKRDSILLDVLFEENYYPDIEPVPIQVSFLQVEREVKVPVPSVDSLLGDKLTAFAPKTIGILYRPERKLDIVKQLFDVGTLFQTAGDLTIADAVYREIHAHQNRYRGATFTVAETLDDTMEATRLLSQQQLKGTMASNEVTMLEGGRKALAGHLIQTNFGLDEARVSAAQAAYVAALLRHGRLAKGGRILRYSRASLEELKTVQLTGRWAILQKLRGANPEAFYYWSLVHKLETA